MIALQTSLLSVRVDALTEVAGGAVRPDTLDVAAVAREHGAFALRIVRRLGVPAADVEDVAQEVFVVLHRRAAEWDPSAPPRSLLYGIARRLLYGIARRLVANYLRRARHQREELGMEEDGHARPATQEQQVGRTQQRALLDQALAMLDADKREVFVLFELEGLDMAEVAELAGCPLKTAYSRLYAARERVKTFVSNLQRTETTP